MREQNCYRKREPQRGINFWKKGEEDGFLSFDLIVLVILMIGGKIELESLIFLITLAKTFPHINQCAYIISDNY